MIKLIIDALRFATTDIGAACSCDASNTPTITTPSTIWETVDVHNLGSNYYRKLPPPYATQYYKTNSQVQVQVSSSAVWAQQPMACNIDDCCSNCICSTGSVSFNYRGDMCTLLDARGTICPLPMMTPAGCGMGKGVGPCAAYPTRAPGWWTFEFPI